jgi:hypothetical protein
MTAKGLVQCLVLSLAIFAACSDDDDDTPRAPLADAGEAAGGTSPVALAGAGPDHAGNGSVGGKATLEGGAPHSAGAGATTNEAGMPPVEMGGAGGMVATSGVERLSLCGRLLQKPILASRFARTFDYAVFNDPCIGWSTALYELTQERDEYLAALSTWSHSFWGCKDLGVESFALLWKQPDVLTAGDANQFIDYYILVLNLELEALSQAELSPSEVSEMRAALKRLSETMVTDPTLEFSHPECDDPPTGEGGAGGADGAGGAGSVSPPVGGAGGEGGVPVLSSAGQGGS